jgi:hypothetical protein
VLGEVNLARGPRVNVDAVFGARHLQLDQHRLAFKKAPQRVLGLGGTVAPATIAIVSISL